MIPTAAATQPTHMGYRVSIPEGAIHMKPLRGDTSRDSVSLMWNHGPRRVNPDLRKGTVVSRPETILGGVKITYPYTLTEDDSVDVDTVARAFPGPRATIYVDEENSARLHVNFWLPKDSIARTDSPTVYLSPADVREIDYYYDLKNRQSLSFRFHSKSFGAMTIPLQYRFGYRAENGQEIDPSFGTGLTAAVYGGYTWGKVRYTYLEHAENAIEQVSSVTVGAFLGVSTAQVDSLTSLSAADPVDDETTVGVVSPGLTVLFGFRGLELGLFGGIDFAGGSAGRKWDYDRRPWIGAGIGFNVWSLLGK
ncbi:MAG TPA: hypothetical protein VFT45_01850 [Longimicrobium sp.]|nr:hypothetical protein [Longimicrobium sp.]